MTRQVSRLATNPSPRSARRRRWLRRVTIRSPTPARLPSASTVPSLFDESAADQVGAGPGRQGGGGRLGVGHQQRHPSVRVAVVAGLLEGEVVGQPGPVAGLLHPRERPGVDAAAAFVLGDRVQVAVTQPEGGDALPVAQPAVLVAEPAHRGQHWRVGAVDDGGEHAADAVDHRMNFR